MLNLTVLLSLAIFHITSLTGFSTIFCFISNIVCGIIQRNASNIFSAEHMSFIHPCQLLPMIFIKKKKSVDCVKENIKVNRVKSRD